jgi:hypothetical protein
MEGYFQRLENVARLAIVALIKLESAGFGVEGTCGRGVWEKLFRPDLRLGQICENRASQVPATEADWESIAKKKKSEEEEHARLGNLDGRRIIVVPGSSLQLRSTTVHQTSSQL